MRGRDREDDIMGTGVLIENVVLWLETIQEEVGMMQCVPSPLPILGC